VPPARPRPGAAATAELIIALPATFFTLAKVISDGFVGRGQVIKQVIKLAASMLSLVALAALATPVHGEDDFPLVGTYTENQACKPNGSDPGVSRVTITPRDIDSVFGLCTILSKKREGATFVVHVECKGPGGSQMLGDVIFTPRADKTIDFSDQDQTYKAVLHKCPD
jgi:hypothetical protein